MGILARLAGKPKDDDIADLLRGILSEDRAEELGSLSAELGAHPLDVCRAALELAMPVFCQHPEFFDFVNGKAKGEW